MNDIRRGKFHDIEIIWDRTEQDLINVVAFQKYFALAICNALEFRFEYNYIMTVFKMLGPTNMPSKQVGLANWRVVDLKLLCGQYGVECEIGGKKIFTLINYIGVKRKFFTFKIQATTNWFDKSFKHVWSMITWNHTLKVKYENLLVLAEIARIQCISTASRGHFQSKIA